MKRKILSIVLSLTMVLTMVPMTGSLSYAAASEPATTFIVNTADNEYLTFTVDDSGNVSGQNNKGETASLPSGITWDNAEKAIVLNGFTGKRIASRETGKELRIKLLGGNTLTGYLESDKICGIFTEHEGIRIMSSSTGTLDININNEERWVSARAIMTSGYTYISDEINIDGGTVNIDVDTVGSFANGIYGGKVSVNNNANLNIDMHSSSEAIDRVYDIYADPHFNTSGIVSLTTNDDCLGANSAYISGTGNYYFLSLGDGIVWGDTSKFTYENGRSVSDYAVYGSENERACAVLGNTSTLTETEVPSVSLSKPETDSRRIDWGTSAQCIYYIKWTPDDDRFAPFTEYTANIHLVPEAGYCLGTYSAADFADGIEGETSLSYADGIITAGFPETGDTSLEIINTAFEMNQPVAGKPLQKTIENADCTGAVEWSINGNYADPGEARENTAYTATVTLKLKDGVDKRFSGIPADSYTVTGAKGTTVTNDAGSKVFKVTFPATGTAEVNAVVDGIECNSATDYSQFNGKVTYDAAAKTLVLNGYDGGYIINRYTDVPLRIKLKGENDIACEYASPVRKYAGIYSCGGDVFLTGTDGAVMNIYCENTSSDSPRGLFSHNLRGDFVIDHVKVNIDLKQIENETQVMTGIYGNTILKNGASLYIDMSANTSSWYSSFDNDITIADDSSWKPVDALITPATDRHGSITFADTELAEKYVVKDLTALGKVLVALKDVSLWDVDLEDDTFEMKAGGFTPAFEGLGGLSPGEDYTVSYENNNAAGTATATLTGMGQFTGSITKQFRILPSLSLKDYKVSLSYSSKIYTGSAFKPSVTVKGLKNGTDYTVSYKNNKAVGKATVTIKGKGAVNGTVTKTFKILPKKAAISKATPGKKKLTVKMGTKVSSTGGSTYQIAYKQKGTSKWKYTTTTKQSKVIKKLKKGKRYYVKVRAYKTVSKVKYYGAWSKQKLSKKIK